MATIRSAQRGMTGTVYIKSGVAVLLVDHLGPTSMSFNGHEIKPLYGLSGCTGPGMSVEMERLVDREIVVMEPRPMKGRIAGAPVLALSFYCAESHRIQPIEYLENRRIKVLAEVTIVEDE